MIETAFQSWSVQKSAALLELVTSGSRGWAQYYADDGPAFVRIGNLDHDTIALDLQDVQHVRPPKNAEGARTKLQPGDILISITAELGMVGLVPKGFGEAYINQHIALARPKPGVDARYLAWFFASEGKRQLLDMRRGMTKAGLGLDDIRNVDVLVPPLNEQRRIVAKLEALQSRSRRAREALDAVPPLLEKLRQSILAAAFRGDLTKDWRAQNPNPEPASALLARIRTERRQKWEASELAKLKAKGKVPANDSWKAKYKEPEPPDTTGLPELPEAWCWANAEEICHEVTVGHVGPMEHRYTTEGVPFLRSQNVRANRYDPAGLRFIPPAFHRELAKSRLTPGDLVIVRSGAPGTACVVPDELVDANCADLVIARLVSSVDPHLMAFYMNSAWATGAVLDAQVGVAQQHFNVGAMRTLHMPVVPPSEQEVLRVRLTKALAGVSTRGQALAEMIRSLSKLEQGILAEAFRGELVPQDPSDEPAAVLLARRHAEPRAESPRRGSTRAKAAE